MDLPHAPVAESIHDADRRSHVPERCFEAQEAPEAARRRQGSLDHHIGGRGRGSARQGHRRLQGRAQRRRPEPRQAHLWGPSFMIFVDTWAWIALASSDDQYHIAATREHLRLKKKQRRYVTSNFVVNETITYLYRKQKPEEACQFINGLLEAADAGVHQLVDVSPAQFRRAWEMRKKYDDKPDISFVDFTSIIVMQDLGISDIFTGDAHFLQVGLGFQLIP